MKRTYFWPLAALGLAMVMAGCNVDRKSQELAKQTAQVINDPVKDVSVTAAKVTQIEESIEVTGELVTASEVSVSAKSPGRIVSVFVADGDAVSVGQVIAQQETTTLSLQASQASAQLQSALAALAQAKSNARVGPTRTSAGVKQAEAALRSAKAQLEKAIRGARSEERAQTEANLRAAKANLDAQKKELERVKELVKEGALAQARLDAQLNAYESAMAQYQNANEALNIVRNGVREEDVAVAREGVRQAEQALETARASKRLDPLLQDQVKVAEAQVESARAQVAIAQQAISDATIRAPFSGRISGRPIQSGTVVSGGTPIAQIVGGEGVYFEAQVPSEKEPQVKPGATVEVSIDAFGESKFVGRVSAVNPRGDSVGRLFNVRINLENRPSGLKPGMYAKGKIAVRTLNNAVLVPASAVVKRGTERFVMVVEDGKAKRVKVTTGIQQGEWLQVSGVSEGSSVISNGQNDVADGTKVRVKTQNATEQKA